MTRMPRRVIGLGVLEVWKNGNPSASPPTAQHYVILLRLLGLEGKDKVKVKFASEQDMNAQRGSRVKAVLFP